MTVAAWALIAHQVQRQTELIRWLRGRSTVVDRPVASFFPLYVSPPPPPSPLHRHHYHHYSSRRLQVHRLLLNTMVCTVHTSLQQHHPLHLSLVDPCSPAPAILSDIPRRPQPTDCLAPPTTPDVGLAPFVCVCAHRLSTHTFTITSTSKTATLLSHIKLRMCKYMYNYPLTLLPLTCIARSTIVSSLSFSFCYCSALLAAPWPHCSLSVSTLWPCCTEHHYINVC